MKDGLCEPPPVIKSASIRPTRDASSLYPVGIATEEVEARVEHFLNNDLDAHLVSKSSRFNNDNNASFVHK